VVELLLYQKYGHLVMDFRNKVIRVADYHRARLDAITRFFVFPLIPKTGDRQ
jgi:hypothetical protein